VSITKGRSATSFFSRAFSASMVLSRRVPATSRPPSLFRQRKNVCSVPLPFRQTSGIWTPGTSASHCDLRSRPLGLACPRSPRTTPIDQHPPSLGSVFH
jgi:hypothetical protein